VSAEEMTGLRPVLRDRMPTPLERALDVFADTDEDELENTTLSVRRGGGVTVNMQNHDWFVVAGFVDRLGLPRRPARVSNLKSGSVITTFAWVGADGFLEESMRLVWFHRND
jgi:hypothetical protein